MTRDVSLPPADRDARGRQGIDRKVFSAVMLVIADRIGREFSDITLALYHRELSAKMDTEAFQRAARIVAAGELFNALPSVDAFLAASRDVSPPCTVSAEDRARRYYAPLPDAVDAFAVDWRDVLRNADAEPKPTGLPKAYALARQPIDASPWVHASDPPTIGTRPITVPTAPRTPAPRRSDFTAVGEIAGRVLAEFAPLEESDVDAR